MKLRNHYKKKEHSVKTISTFISKVEIEFDKQFLFDFCQKIQNYFKFDIVVLFEWIRTTRKLFNL